MISAKKGGVAEALLDRYVAGKVRSAFRGVWMRGTLPADGPLLVYANHPGFWDGFVMQRLAAATRREGYCLMDETNLRRYRFLRRLGAFSIRRGDPRSTLESVRYAARLLARPRAMVVVFPEGELRPFGSPLDLERGVEVLARLARATCVPVAIRYAFFEHERPDVLLEIGAAHVPRPRGECALRLAAVVARAAAASSPAGFAPVVRGRRSAAERWDAVRGLAATAPPWKAAVR